MSRAFVSEDRGLEQLQVAPRAVLPAGAPNWVTPGGFRLLEREREQLATESRNEKDVAKLTALRQMQAELEYRLASAQIIDLSSNPPAEIRFGATVRLRSEDTEREVKLVGADEADPSTGMLSIHSPLARALLGKLPGQTVILHTDEGEAITTSIIDISYTQHPGQARNSGTMSNSISTPNDLIQILKDGQQGFQEAAKDVESADLKLLFNELSLQRSAFAGELQALVVGLGEPKPETGGSIAGALHRGWIDLKSAVTSKDNHAILAECERGEDSAVAHYRKALEDPDLPADLRATIETQSIDIKAAHDRVRDLRNALAPVEA